MKREHKTKAWIGAAIVALIVAFIWGNSLLPQTQSRQESDFVLRILQSIFRLDIDRETASHLVRKAAHFTEYALLGVSAAALFLSRRRCVQSAVNAMSLCLAVAVLDESIQLLSQRGSQVQDVLLDFSGAAAGLLIFLALSGLFRIFRRRKAASPR